MPNQHTVFQVPKHDNQFGTVLKHGLKGTVIIMIRTGGGLIVPRKLNYTMLPHQVYQQKIEPLIKLYEPLEILVVDIDNGGRKTIWKNN